MNTQVETQERVRKEVVKGTLEVSKVYQAPYQKAGTLTAEIKQTVTTDSYYPSKSVSTNLQDNPFATADFGFAETKYSSPEKRVVWIDVPAESTVESVVAKLASLPNAGIYKILANKPIISDSQKYAIEQGLTTMAIIADRQVIRFPEGSEKAGQLILENGKPQYRATFFKATEKADEDMRNADPADFYATPKIQMELAGVSNSISVEQEAM